MKGKESLTLHLRKAKEHLQEARILMKLMNKDGKQYDMCNAPSLYDVDGCYERAKEIHDIYYQKLV